jgi:hypothetical protein
MIQSSAVLRRLPRRLAISLRDSFMKKPILYLSALILFAAITGSIFSQARVERRQLALVGGVIYINPNEPPIKDGAILIRDGQDCGGRSTEFDNDPAGSNQARLLGNGDHGRFL